jgi:hypothetical protein
MDELSLECVCHCDFVEKKKKKGRSDFKLNHRIRNSQTTLKTESLKFLELSYHFYIFLAKFVLNLAGILSYYGPCRPASWPKLICYFHLCTDDGL